MHMGSAFWRKGLLAPGTSRTPLQVSRYAPRAGYPQRAAITSIKHADVGRTADHLKGCALLHCVSPPRVRRSAVRPFHVA